MAQIPCEHDDCECVQCGGHHFLDVYYDDGECVPDEFKCADCGKKQAIEEAEMKHKGITWDDVA